MYRPVSGLYEVWKLHKIADESGGYIAGNVIVLFDTVIYNKVTLIYE